MNSPSQSPIPGEFESAPEFLVGGTFFFVDPLKVTCIYWRARGYLGSRKRSRKHGLASVLLRVLEVQLDTVLDRMLAMH